MTDEQNQQSNQGRFRIVEIPGAKSLEETWKGAMVDQSLQRLIDSPPENIAQEAPAQPAPTRTAQAQAQRQSVTSNE